MAKRGAPRYADVEHRSEYEDCRSKIVTVGPEPTWDELTSSADFDGRPVDFFHVSGKGKRFACDRERYNCCDGQ